MKIAFLNIYSGRVLRGSEIFVAELATRMSTHHEVWVFQSGISQKVSYQTITISNIPLIFHQQGLFRSLLYTALVFLFTLRCFPQLLRENFDWVVPINGRLQVLLCRFLRLLNGTKILISGHSGMGIDDRINIIFGKPDIFIALSQAAANWAKKVNTKQKVAYIPNGVDTKSFNPKILPATVQLKSPIVICVAALVPYKRMHLLIRAVEKLKDASLLIIGDGPLKLETERLGKDRLKGRFLLIPNVSHEKLPAYYRAASLFSLPSKEYESFGLVYLEALACNIPVVAPDDKIRRDIIQTAGLYCNVESVIDYARTLDIASKTNFGMAPRNQALKFSWDKIAGKYEKNYLREERSG